MPYFFVIVNGDGIEVPSSDDEVIGFYTTRYVKAERPDEAERIASELIMRDWTEGEYAKINKGDPPRLSVESIGQVGLLEYLWRRPGGGHTFYSAE